MEEQEQEQLQKILTNTIELVELTGAPAIDFTQAPTLLDKLELSLTELNRQFVLSLLDRVELSKYQQALEDATDIILIARIDGTIVHANKASYILASEGDLYLKQSFYDLPFWKGQLEKTQKEIEEIVIQQKKELHLSTKTKDAHEKDFYADFKITPVLDAQKNVRHFVALGRDITKEQEFEQSRKDFLSIASHELKTPLTAIQWNLQLLEETELTKKQLEFTSQMTSISNRLLDLVKMLLNTSRIDIGTVAIKPEKINIKEVLETILHEFRPEIQKKSLSIHANYPTKMRAILLDKQLITVAFQNLISNAVKYNLPKGEVGVEVIEQANSYKISVSDRGIGIPKEEQARIFEKMYRATNAKTSTIGGTGLGLYITKWVVETAGGSISFTSSRKGTTFTMTLPFTGMQSKEGSTTLHVAKE